MPNTNGSFQQLAVTGTTSVSPPTNAVGFILQAFDSNTANVNWALGGTLAASGSGMQLEPGRDTGYQSVATTLSVCPATTGSQTVGILWVKSS